MDINKAVEATSINIALTGRLDTNTAPELEAEIKSSLDGMTSLVFDLKELEYISSAGLRVLLGAQKIMNKQGTMKITNASDDVKEIFEVTGFDEILDIE